MALFTDPDWQARNWIRDIVAHHAAENAALQRAAAAKGYEMPLAEQARYARPFPGTTMINAPNLNAGSGPSPTPAAGAAAVDAALGAPARGLAGLAIGPWALAGLMGLSSVLGAGAGGVGLALASRLWAPPAPPAAVGEAEIRVFWGDQEITPEAPAEAETQ